MEQEKLDLAHAMVQQLSEDQRTLMLKRALVGTVVLAKAATNPEFEKNITELLDATLVLPGQRSLFGLPTIAQRS